MIIEGSINDRRLPATGYQEAVTAAWDALAGAVPVGDDRRSSARLRRCCRSRRRPRASTPTCRPSPPQRGWWYISPIADEWITPANYAEVIDTAIGRYHPSTGGHAYLATRLAEALAAMSGATDVVADAPHDAELDRPLTGPGSPTREPPRGW